jgi:CheY-like chemotaxis protein
VANAQQALRELKVFQPHVIIADVGLAGEDGYSLVRRIRGLPSREGGLIPAIALTAYARAEDRRQALAAGFDLHLSKPVDPQALRVAVAEVLRKHDNG